MVIVICGGTGSGKSTLEQMLYDKKGYKKFISYTTRTKREKEVDGVHYHFITQEEFIDKATDGFFAEYDIYGGNYYRTAAEDYQDTSDNTNRVAVLTPAGVDAVKKIASDNCLIVYIKTDVATNIKRFVKRANQNITLEDLKNLCQRLEDDERIFAGMEKKADIVIDNRNGTKLENHIEKIYEYAHNGFKRACAVRPSDLLNLDNNTKEINVVLEDGRKLNIHETDNGYDWTLYDQCMNIIDGGIFDNTDGTLQDFYDVLAKEYHFAGMSATHSDEDFEE